MPIDDRTANRNYKLPNAGNFLADDVVRLRDALTAIDADIFARYTKAETDQKLADLINGAPGALDTLNELAAAMGDDPNFAATITNALAGALSFTQAGIGAVTRTVDGKLKDVVSVKDFGAAGDGIADDTGAVQAALNYLTAYTTTESGFNRGGRSLFVPAGNYKITSTLTIAPRHSVTIYGEGAASCIFGDFGLDAPLLVVGDASRQMVGFHCKDLSFASAAQGSLANTVCMTLKRHYNAIIENCTFDRAFTSLDLYGVGHSYIRGCEIRRNGNVNNGGTKNGYGIVFNDDGVIGGSYGVHIDDCEFWGGGDDSANFIKANIYVRDIDGLYVTNTHMYNAEHAVWVDPDGVHRNTVTTLQFSNTYFDRVTGPHLLVTGKVNSSGTGNKVFGEFLFANCYFRQSGNNHVKFQIASDNEYPLKNVLFTGCLFRDCSAQSFLNNSVAGKVAGYKIESCIFDTCARSGGTNVIQDLVAGDTTIRNCSFTDTASLMSGPATSAILLTPAAGADVCIADNEYLISTSNSEPVTIGELPRTIRSLELTGNRTTSGGAVIIDRAYDATIPASDTGLLAVLNVAERFSGVIEYTLFGNDDANADLGHHAHHGYFAFRRPAAGGVIVYNHTVAFSHTFGTLGANAVTVGVFTPNCFIRIDNAHTGTASYTAKLRIIKRFAAA